MGMPVYTRKPPSERMPSRVAFDAIKVFEGFRPVAYQDEGGVWTIGWGCTDNVKQGDTITIGEADAWLLREVAEAAQIVRNSVNVDLTQAEFDSLVIYAYNFGHLKPSLLACLNGGVTDAKEVMASGSYAAVIPQIVRAHWDEKTWKGENFPDGKARKLKTPIRGLYRRRLAEACIWQGLTEWQGPCSENLIKLPVELYQDKTGAWKARANAEEMTDPDWVFQRATEEMRYKPPVMDVQKPFPEVVKPAPAPIVTVIVDKPPERVEVTPAPLPDSPLAREGDIPTQLPIPGPFEDEPEEAAPIIAKSDVVGEVPVASQPPAASPASVSVSGTSAPEKAGRVDPLPPSPPPALPSSLPPPPKPVVIAPKTIDINAIPYGEIDAANGAKNMSESKRVIGMVVVGIGSVIQVVTTRLGVGTAIGAVTFDLSRDPVVVALLVGAIVGVVAFITRKRGTKIVTKGMVEARQVLK